MSRHENTIYDNDDASRDTPLLQRRIFTTGEAAALCNVSQQTIIRCFDSGRLSGFRVPGSKFRRIPREDLVRFMRENQIPTDVLEHNAHPADRRRVLIVDDDPSMVRLLQAGLETGLGAEFRTAGTAYGAGLLSEAFRPHLMVLDLMLPDVNGETVCRRIRATPELCGMRILCISATSDAQVIESVRRAGADEFLAKPFTPEKVLHACRLLLAREAWTVDERREAA